MAIKKGDKVKVNYTGTLEDGTVFDSSEGKEPLEFEVGSGQVIEGFDAAVIGKNKGDDVQITIAPDKAYGGREDDLIKKVPRSSLPKDKAPERGMMLILTTPDGQQVPAMITNVTETDISIDLNHPLAGKTLNFKMKIVDVNGK